MVCPHMRPGRSVKIRIGFCCVYEHHRRPSGVFMNNAQLGRSAFLTDRPNDQAGYAQIARARPTTAPKERGPRGARVARYLGPNTPAASCALGPSQARVPRPRAEGSTCGGPGRFQGVGLGRRSGQQGLLWRRGAWPFFAVRAFIASCALLASLLARARNPGALRILDYHPRTKVPEMPSSFHT